MIISSELTGKTYKTVEECLKAEKEYKLQKEEAERNKTVAASQYDTWFESYWSEKIGYSSTSDEDLQKMLDQYSTSTDASASDAE